MNFVFEKKSHSTNADASDNEKTKEKDSKPPKKTPPKKKK